MLLSATAFTVSELLMENQQGGKIILHIQISVKVKPNSNLS